MKAEKPDSGKKEPMFFKGLRDIATDKNTRHRWEEALASSEQRIQKAYEQGVKDAVVDSRNEYEQKLEFEKDRVDVWMQKCAEKDKEIKNLRQDAIQECCICGTYASCNQVSIGGGVHFRCCSRECLNKLFEYEDKLKGETLSGLRDDLERKHKKLHGSLAICSHCYDFEIVLKAIDSRRTA